MAETVSPSRVMLGMLGILMAMGGTIVFAYGAFMTMYIVRPSYRFVSPPIAWVSMMLAGFAAIFVAALAIFFACRPRPYRLVLLTKLCIFVLVLKIIAIIVTREVTSEDRIEKRIKTMFNDSAQFAFVEMELKCCGINNYFDYPGGMIKMNNFTQNETDDQGITKIKYEVKFFKIVLAPLSCYAKKMYHINKPNEIEEAVTYLNHDFSHEYYPYKMNNKMKQFYNISESQDVEVAPCSPYDVWKKVDEPVNAYAPSVIYPDVHFNDLLLMLRSDYTELCNAFSKHQSAFPPPNVEGIGNGPDLRPTYQRGCKKIILDEVDSFRSQMISTLATVINEITVAITATVYANSLMKRDLQQETI